MGGQRQSSKGGGGYVGGFLQLFDWNAKSRKKLFPTKSDIPDQSKQKKRSDGNLPMTRFNLAEMDVDDYVAASNFKGSRDCSCASSVTDDEGFRSKAPNVVARLMGLDTMPASNHVEPFSTPFSDSQSLRESKYVREKLQFRPENYDIYSSTSRNKVDTPVQKAEKIMNMPIEKFQSEILPPKSAKTIPITHHKLLSPIKSPGFISSNNAAHIMEAAAKIIEPGPQASTSKVKMPSVGKSSVPFKVRELREKVEASQKPSKKPVESNAAKILKGQPMNKSWNGSPDSEDHLSRNNKGKSISLALQAQENVDSEDHLDRNNKGKSTSLALQAKENVDYEDHLGRNSKGKSISLALLAKENVQKRGGRKETSEIVLIQSSKPQSDSQRSMPKRPPIQNSKGALKQNNQKQNCPIDKEKLNSKSSLSSSQDRLKISFGDSSLSRHKNSSKSSGNSKVGSRKLSPEATDSKGEVLYSNTRHGPRKRRSLDGNSSKEKNRTVDSMLVDSDEKPKQSNLVVERESSWAEESKRKGMDVVSFTFTAPLSRQSNVFGSDYRSKNAMLSSDSRENGNLSLMECNEIGADDLSILLEQKLRELTKGIESSRHRADSSAPSFQDAAPTRQTVASIITMPHKLQGNTMEMEDCRINKEALQYRHPSPISVLDPSIMTESWNSSETLHSLNFEGSNTRQGSSVRALEVLGMNSYINPHFMDLDTELIDSASSSSVKTLAKVTNVAISTSSCTRSKWEIWYISDVLFDIELMFNEFLSGRAFKIINPNLFDRLENKKGLEENQKLERKVLFNCVSECVDSRFIRYTNTDFKTWVKGLSTVKRKERLVEDIYKEISNWKGKDDSMVDDLVDKDMSSQYGKWLDFEIEAFELGIEIEGRILNSLINEVVLDLVM